MSEAVLERNCDNFHNMKSDMRLILLNGLNINSNEMKDSAVSEIPKLDENQYSLTDENTSGDSDGTDTKTYDSDKEIKDYDVGKILDLDEDQYFDNENLSKEDESDAEYDRVALPVDIEDEEMWDDNSDDYWDPSVRDITWDNTCTKANVENKWTPVEGQFDDSTDDIS